MSWDITKPLATDPVSSGDDQIRELKTDVQAALKANNATLGDAGAFPGADVANPKFHYRGLKGTTAQRPAAGNYGLYYNTDLNLFERDNGTTWETVGNSNIFLNRPSFYSTDSQNIIIPASTLNPAYVKISNVIYKNTSDLVVDSSVSGANGLDTGTFNGSTTYYLYAILPVSGFSFRGVISASPPTTGPTGFSTNWSYLGSFRNGFAVGGIEQFNFVNGKYTTTGSGAAFYSYTLSGASGSVTLEISSIAKECSGVFNWNSCGAVGNILKINNAFFNVMNSISTTANLNPSFFFSFKVDSKVFNYTISGSGNSITFLPWSWIESPTDYK